MFTLHAFATTTSGTYSSLTNIAPPSDPVLALSGNFLYVPVLNNLIGAYAFGAAIQRGQLSTPSLLADVPYDITPVDAATIPAAVTLVNIHPEDPIALVTDEPLQALVTTGSNSTATIGIWLSDGAIAKVSGRILRVRGTFTTGSTADVWSNASLTLTNQLAEGTYQLVGARAEGSHGKLFRFVFPGGTNATRPGAIFSNARGGVSNIDPIFRNGNLGVWGTFSNRVLPTIDNMTDGNSETATLIMDLIKTA